MCGNIWFFNKTSKVQACGHKNIRSETSCVSMLSNIEETVWNGNIEWGKTLPELASTPTFQLSCDRAIELAHLNGMQLSSMLIITFNDTFLQRKPVINGIHYCHNESKQMSKSMNPRREEEVMRSQAVKVEEGWERRSAWKTICQRHTGGHSLCESWLGDPYMTRLVKLLYDFTAVREQARAN